MQPFAVLLLAMGLLAPAQAVRTPAQDPPQTPQQTPQNYVLGPEDQLKIWAFGIDEISDKPIRVDPSGNIDLPVAGKIHAGGLTIEQLRAELVQRFSKEVLRPQVSVEIADFGSQPVSVVGAVNHPGVHQIQGRKTLLEVVSQAEGLRQDAGPRIHISRQIAYGAIPLPTAQTDQTGKFSVAEVSIWDLMAGKNPAENIPILPHDVVTVPIAEAVFVMGAVRKPGEVPLKDNASISVLQALASAEGLGPTPSPKNATIVRFVDGTSERKEIPVNLKKIQEGKA